MDVPNTGRTGTRWLCTDGEFAWHLRGQRAKGNKRRGNRDNLVKRGRTRAGPWPSLPQLANQGLGASSVNVTVVCNNKTSVEISNVPGWNHRNNKPRSAPIQKQRQKASSRTLKS